MAALVWPLRQWRSLPLVRWLVHNWFFLDSLVSELNLLHHLGHNSLPDLSLVPETSRFSLEELDDVFVKSFKDLFEHGKKEATWWYRYYIPRRPGPRLKLVSRRQADRTNSFELSPRKSTRSNSPKEQHQQWSIPKTVNIGIRLWAVACCFAAPSKGNKRDTRRWRYMSRWSDTLMCQTGERWARLKAVSAAWRPLQQILPACNYLR